MSAVARVTKITAASPKSFQDAVDEGLSRASKTLRGISGLEVISQKAKVEGGKITEYRATIEITFILEGKDPRGTPVGVPRAPIYAGAGAAPIH